MGATMPRKLARDDAKALRVAPSVSVGSVLDGKYKVEALLGQGGMGVVVAARHEALGTRVAVKVLHAELATVPALARRAMREARAAGSLESEHVARVVDVGHLASGEPYIAMDLLEGMDLGRVLAAKGPLPVRDVASWLDPARAVDRRRVPGGPARDQVLAEIDRIARELG